MLISESYRDLNSQLHRDNATYGTSSGRWAPVVTELAATLGATSVLDYGAGRRRLRAALPKSFWARGWLLAEYDPAIPDIAAPPSAADLLVSTDVLEHIEPDCLAAVLDDIKQLARKAVLLTVATRPAMKTLADGRNAHLIVEPASWWLPQLEARWEKIGFTALPGEFVFIGRAK